MSNTSKIKKIILNIIMAYIVLLTLPHHVFPGKIDDGLPVTLGFSTSWGMTDVKYVFTGPCLSVDLTLKGSNSFSIQYYHGFYLFKKRLHTYPSMTILTAKYRKIISFHPLTKYVKPYFGVQAVVLQGDFDFNASHDPPYSEWNFLPVSFNAGARAGSKNIYMDFEVSPYFLFDGFIPNYVGKLFYAGLEFAIPVKKK